MMLMHTAESSGQHEERVVQETALFPAKLESIPAIRDGIEKDLEGLGWDRDSIDDLLAAVSDAVMNSIGRGSLGIKGKLPEDQMLSDAIKKAELMRPNATITVTEILKPQEAVVTIDDQGEGFDFKTRQGNEFREHDTATNGRGVGMMKIYADVKYENGGRRIIITKKRSVPERG